MELRLYFEDSETEESREKILPNPDAGALRQALEEMVEQPKTVPVAVLVHSNEQDFIQFYVLDPDEEAAEPTAERLCHVEYCRRHWGGRHAQFFTEKLAFSEVLEIFKRYLDGDESWQKKGEWKKLVRAGPESGEDFRDKAVSLAMAAAFFAGCIFVTFWFARIMFFLFGALFVWNAFRSIGYETGKPWSCGADAWWDTYDDGQAAKKKKEWKPPSGQAIGAFVSKNGCGLCYILATVFFIIWGIATGSCRNGFNRKAGKEPARVQGERKAGDEGGLRSPDERKPPGGGQAIKPGAAPR